MSVIKFFKTLLATGFRPYSNELIKTNLLDPIFEDIIPQNMGKHNLLYSVALDFLRFLAKKDFLPLSQHVFSRHQDIILETTKKFPQWLEQAMRAQEPAPSPAKVFQTENERKFLNSDIDVPGLAEPLFQEGEEEVKQN